MKARLRTEREKELQENKELSQLLVSELLEERIDFDWKIKPINTWGNLSQKEIVVYVQQIALLIGITNENAKMLRILFADNQKSLGGKHHIAVILPKYSRGLKYLQSLTIIFNRSKKIFKSRQGVQEVSGKRQVDTADIQTEALPCILDTAKECMLWMIIEELTHSKLLFMAKTRQLDQSRDKKYKAIRKKKKRQARSLYENSYQEMVAARYCVKVLSILMPEKSEYFNKVLKISINQGIRPIPYVVDEAKQSLFI